jgi:aspartyl protease family protein
VNFAGGWVRRSGRLVLAALALLAPAGAGATSVYVMSLAFGRADVVVNGATVRQLREGQTSPEGVTLVKSDGKQATFQYDGKTYVFGIGQTNSPSVVLQADSRGHFITTAYINDVPVQAMVDTGASSVALNRNEAARMGINYTQGQRGVTRTANGAAAVWLVTLASVRLGDIVARNVTATVTEGGPEQLPIVLLGMSFLNQLEMQRAGSTMTLTKRD